MMETWFLGGAALASLAGALIHGVAGHRLYYMDSIRASELAARTKTLSLVSWHMFTIFLLVGAGVLAFMAFAPAPAAMAYPLILINALGAAMFIGLALGGHRDLVRLPGAYLMAATALLAWLGVS